jgi:hypothetical protein
MLNINPQTVCFLIDKAREFHAKEEVTIPEMTTSPSDDWAMQVLADHRDDMTYGELHSTINDLEPDQQVELVALMWVGRGDYDADEWDAATQNAKDEWNNRTAEYVIATPLLADYLSEALNQLGYSCEE